MSNVNKSEQKEKLQHYLNQTIYKILGPTVAASWSLTDYQKKKN